MIRTEGLDETKLVDIVAKDFWFFRNKFCGILIFGSHVKDYQTPVSDIDVCIVTKKTSKQQKRILYNEIFPILKKAQIFEAK